MAFECWLLENWWPVKERVPQEYPRELTLNGIELKTVSRCLLDGNFAGAHNLIAQIVDLRERF